MLLELRLENYAVIDSLTVEFSPGLNLLTGETGAGKSILIDALGLLLGEKASSDLIRSGTDRAVLSAVFQVEGASEKTITRILDENGLDSDQDSIILRRELSTSGKGRVFVNNQPATVLALKQLAPHFATIHAQNETLLSFDAAARLALLDVYSGTQLGPIGDAYVGWKGIRGRIAELEQDEQERLRLVDLWSYQKREIEEARLQPGEDQKLENEKRVLANAEKIYTAAMNAFDLLYAGESSTASSLRAARKQVEELSRYEPRFEEALSTLENARIGVEDVGASLRDFAGGIQASPEHLAEVEDRLAVIYKLKRKYGPTLEDVINFGADVTSKLSQLENKDEVLRVLRIELAQAAGAYLKASREVSRKRREAARGLEKLVETELNELAMKASFKIEVQSSEEDSAWSHSGLDRVSYLISTNPGEDLRPLEDIASGGELSRVMLALKSTIEAASTSSSRKRSGGQRTLVFDEIDTGIGGRAAEAVGKKLKSLARANQVLCVTHLPQIATFAQHHYLIEKKESGGRTRTTVRLITGEERTAEVARMLSGAKLTETSRKHAEQLLKINA